MSLTNYSQAIGFLELSMMDHPHSVIKCYLLIIFHVTGNVLHARNTIMSNVLAFERLKNN